MCKVLDKTKVKHFKGYKAVIEKNGKYYSPTTGYCYKIGKLPKMKKVRKNADTNWANTIFDVYYDEKMQGKTGVFKSIHGLRTSRIMDMEGSYVILEMTIGGEIYNGSMNYAETMVGTEILSMKKY